MKPARFLLAALAAGLLAAPALAADTAAAQADDNPCIACHAAQGNIDAAAFARSVHAPLGCPTCHADVDLKKHPPAARKYASDRERSRAGAQVCRGCHGSIYDAFAASVHGKSDNAAAPICADCHSAHSVSRAAVGTHLREACTNCHADTLEKHKAWLPNTQRHLASVACAACHSPGAGRRIDLRLYDAASKAEPETNAAAPAATPLDDRALRDVLQAANRAAPRKVSLVGRLEAATPEESHGLARKADALSDCAACHRKGAAPFQNVSFSVVGPDGRRVRYEAKSEVLHGPATVDSMRAFYAPGGTRIQALDILLALAVFGGVSAPLGHLVLRKLLRRKEPQ